MKNIAVFFGGTSVEREVSVITGVLTLNSVDKTLFNPVPIYIADDGGWYTGQRLFDIDEYKTLDLKKLTRVCVMGGSKVLYSVKRGKLKELLTLSCGVNCLHGERGEDGCLYGALAMSNVPIASPPALASAVSMDKEFTKIALKGVGVKTLSCVAVDTVTALNERVEGLEYPLIVKPACLGSSIGVTKAENFAELKGGVALALRYGAKAVIEKCLEGFTELNCACYRGADGNLRISEIERPIGVSEVLDFNDKYSGGNREFPAKIPKAVSNKIKDVTAKVYNAFGFSGVIRIDYMLCKDGLYLNEINSVPGSLAYYLFCDTLKEFSSMLTELIRAAEKEYAVKSTFSVKYSSNVLNFNGSKGGKSKKG